MKANLSPRAFEELLEHSVDVITVLDASGIILYESPSIERMLGYAPEGLVGESVFDYVHPDDRQEVFETFVDTIDSPGESTGSVELRFRCKDGSWLWVESRGVNRAASEIDGFVVTSRDISERKAYEQRIERQNERLEEFASIVSHDLRNPLNVAEGRLELARADCDSDHLDDVARSHDRMRTLIDDLLTLAREGDAAGRTTPVDLRAAVEECWQYVDTRDTTLVVETDRVVEADESRLHQLLSNLLRNAIEHGGTTVIVGDLPDGFYVVDDGDGIPEADRVRVLEAGVSSDTDGTGLGLGIVAGTVADHGWDLTVTEGRAGGARFEVRGVTTGEECDASG